MAKKNAYDEARDLFGRVGAGTQGLYNQARSFVQQNPTPAGYLARKIAPSIQQPFNTVGQAVGGYIRGPVSPVPVQGVQRFIQPVRDVAGNIAQDYIQSFPSKAASAIRMSPPAQLGQAARNVYYNPSPQVVARQQLGQAGNALSLALDVGTLPYGAGVITKTAEQLGKQGLKQAVKSGAISGTKYGGIYGLTGGLFTAKDEQDLKKYVSAIAGSTAVGAAGGGVLGGAAGGAGYTVGKTLGTVANALKRIFPQKSDKEIIVDAKGFFHNELDRFAGRKQKQQEPLFYGELRESLGLPRNGDYQSGAINLGAEIFPSKKSVTQAIDISPSSVASSTKESQKIKSKIPLPTQEDGGLPSGQGNLPSENIISQDPVQKIINALKEAKPIRGKQEALYSKERAKRVAQVASLGEKVSGEQGYFAQLGQLKGELPKVEFESLRKQIAQPDIDNLFNMVEQSNLPVFEKITAKTGLAKLLGSEGGKVPTRGELELLGEIFPPEFMKAVLDKRSMFEKLFQLGQETLSIPKSLMATADFSAAFRQGIALIGRPKQWVPAFRDMFKYAFSDKAYKGLLDDIRSRPTYQLMREHKLALTDVGSSLTKREEQFMSTIPEKIPLFGGIVKGSNRAYTGFLNKLRADVFDDLVKNAKQSGLELSPKLLDDAAMFVNSASGRGDLGTLNKAATILNMAFFSPRLIASRINLLNPIYYAKLDPFVRKEALRTILSSAGIIGSIATAAKLGGLDVGTDPRSADYLKVKSGNTRWDIGGGFAQYIRLFAQLVTGEQISTITGRKITFGEGYKPITRLGVSGNFLKSKLDPVASLAVGALEGKTSLGEDFNIKKEMVSRFIPLVFQDMADLYKEYGAKGIPLALPGVFGVGSQTYGPLSNINTENPTINEQKKIKNTAIDYYVRGNAKKAMELKNKNQFSISQEDIDSYTKIQLRKATAAYVSGDKEEAMAIKKDYGLTISNDDVLIAAKKLAISLYKDGKITEAMEIKKKYGFSITTKDVEY